MGRGCRRLRGLLEPGSLTGPWLWSPWSITNKAETPSISWGSDLFHSEGTAPTPNLRNSAWCLAQCFSNVATSQNHLEALNKPEWIQPAGQWVASPLLSKLPPVSLQVRAACTIPRRKECLTETQAEGSKARRLGQRWESGQGHGPRSTVSQPLPVVPTTGRATGRFLWPLGCLLGATLLSSLRGQGGHGTP